MLTDNASRILAVGLPIGTVRFAASAEARDRHIARLDRLDPVHAAVHG